MGFESTGFEEYIAEVAKSENRDAQMFEVTVYGFSGSVASVGMADVGQDLTCLAFECPA